MKLLGMATGNLARVKESTNLCDINGILDFFRTLNIQAVEVSYANPEELDVQISKENIAYLRGLEYKSIHAPYKHTFDTGNESIAILQKMKKLYDAINADHIIMHPNRITDLTLVQQFHILFENLSLGKNWGYLQLKPFFQQNDYGFCFDTTHAMTIDSAELDSLLTFGKRIKEVHLSNYTDQEHTRFYDSTNYDIILSKIKKLNVPIIIEEGLRTDETMRQEIDFIRHYLF